MKTNHIRHLRGVVEAIAEERLAIRKGSLWFCVLSYILDSENEEKSIQGLVGWNAWGNMINRVFNLQTRLKAEREGGNLADTIFDGLERKMVRGK